MTSRQILLLSTALCFLLIAISFFDSSTITPLRVIANYTVVPMEKGINHIGNWIINGTDRFQSVKDLQAENEALQLQVESLTQKNTQLASDTSELARLQELYELDQTYLDYPKTAARVIGRSGSNWFYVFTIDKGSNDGIEVDMNVISGGGLVGIVTEVGPSYATVRSIIDDGNNVSAMSELTSDLCFVTGSLSQYQEGTINFTDMANNANDVKIGDALVTSYISDKYVPGLMIGTIREIHVDSNNLTRSGLLTPAVDFEHIQEVLVITQKKDTMISTDSGDNEQTEETGQTETTEQTEAIEE